MYTIYVDDKLLYSPKFVDDGYLVTNAKLTLEVNKAGSLTFVLPPNNILYGDIQKLKSIVTVYQDGEEIFRGRVIHDEKDFYNRKDVYCEGELSFLLDSVQRPYHYNGTVQYYFEMLINNHNSQVESAKRFEIGTIDDLNYGNSIIRSNDDYVNTWDEINDKLIGTLGGYIRIRVSEGTRYIDYIKDYNKTNSQVIEFGVNMLDISEYISAEEVFTVLVPLGAEIEDEYGNITGRVDITSVNDGKDYLESTIGVSLFGKIWKVEIWDEITTPSYLLNRATNYLHSGVQMAVTLTMDAVDLHLFDIDTERIGLGDSVQVISAPHGLDRYFTCTKLQVNLAEPDKSTYTFGSSYTALTEKNVSDTKEAFKIAKESTGKIVEASRSIAEINKNLNQEGIFNLLTNSGQIQGIILDEETGDIYVNASYIKSGVLTLGGVDNVNGVLQILDKDGNVVVEGNKDGLNLTGVVNATGGSLNSVTIVDGITISKKDDSGAKDLSLVKVETVQNGAGTSYVITFGELTGRSTPIAIEGSFIKIRGASSISFSADNIIFENSIEVPEVYITKEWTALTLLNDFEVKNFEAEQLEYRRIGNHVYIRGAVKFPDGVAWSGSAIPVANLPTIIKPTKGNHYSMNACDGSRIAKVIATASDGLSIEWIRKLTDGTPDTTGTGIWVSMNMDYWVD